MSILSKVKEKIIKAQPNIDFRLWDKEKSKYTFRDLNLADVLIALRGKGDINNGVFYGIDVNGNFTKLYGSAWEDEYLLPKHCGGKISKGIWEDCPNIIWQLGKDLDHQKLEVWEFILNLISKP